MKIKTLLYIIVGFTILFTTSNWYIEQNTLKKPILLQHLISKPYYSGTSDVHFELFYFTNRFQTPAHLTSVSTEKYPNLHFQVVSSLKEYDQHLYTGNKAYIKVSKRDVWPEDIHLSELTFHFSDGTVMTEDIGEIHLYKRTFEETSFQHFGGGSSSIGESYSMANIVRTISLTELDVPFYEKLHSFTRIDWKVENGFLTGNNHEKIERFVDNLTKSRDIESDLPIELTEDHSFFLLTKIDKQKMYDSNIHFLDIEIEGKFLQDERFFTNGVVHIGEQFPHVTLKQLKLYIDAKKGGDGQ